MSDDKSLIDKGKDWAGEKASDLASWFGEKASDGAAWLGKKAMEGTKKAAGSAMEGITENFKMENALGIIGSLLAFFLGNKVSGMIGGGFLRNIIIGGAVAYAAWSYLKGKSVSDFTKAAENDNEAPAPDATSANQRNFADATTNSTGTKLTDQKLTQSIEKRISAQKTPVSATPTPVLEAEPG